MIRRLEILLLSSIIIIFSYLTATLSYSIGLTMIGPVPTARAGNYKWHYADLNPEIVQYGIFLNDPTNGDYKNFAEWQTKKIFKQTLSELESTEK